MQILHNEFVYNSKKEAIAAIEAKLAANPDVYGDSESIVVRFKDGDGDIVSVNGVINKVDGKFHISTSIDDSETLKVVESTTPPDEDVIWLHEDSANTYDFQEDIITLRKQVETLTAIVRKHEYAFENELNAGTISADTDSTRETIIASSEYFDYVLIEYPEKDEELQAAISAETVYTRYETVPTFPDEYSPSFIQIDGDYYALTYYPGEEEPNYPQYAIPNVKHICIKSAQSESELQENILNLLENELIWCEGTKSLYIRTKSSTGAAKVVKIGSAGGSGSSEIIDDDETGTTDYVYVKDDTLYIESEKVSVSDDGTTLTINMPTAHVTDGVLYLTGESK